jgi:uncharacterized membrane protein YkoI
MTFSQPLMTAASGLLIALITASAVLAESQTAQDPAAEAQAFLTSPTTLAQATATAEAAAGGKVSSIEYKTGENGAPDLIMAAVTLTDGTEKTVAINPTDGKVMNVTLAANDMTDGENGAEDGADGENANN